MQRGGCVERTMGKYMRKCRGEEAVSAMEVTQAVGVRTRSREAAAKVVVSKRRKAQPPSPAVYAVASSLGEGGSCYLKLRSRMLFMAPPPPASASAAGAGHGAALATCLSRCSSTASSVDAAAAQDRSLPCGSDAAKADGGGHIPEGSASDSSESGLDRERRETTPSSHLPGDFSDLESDLAGQNRSRSLPQTLTTHVQATARVRIPPAVEIEEFFAAAEEAEAKRFASKYNFEFAHGVPLDAGRFEWTPAVSSS